MLLSVLSTARALGRAQVAAPRRVISQGPTKASRTARTVALAGTISRSSCAPVNAPV